MHIENLPTNNIKQKNQKQERVRGPSYTNIL